jgi:adenosylcobinamide-GDP ribazoletransferase
MTGARAALPPPLRGVRAAFVSLTRVPVGGFPYSPMDFTWATAHAPLVGAVVGLATGAVFRLLAPVGDSAAGLLAIGFSMLVTGAFHEDGLADTCDALGGGYERARVFAILKDSRVGAFGASALVVSIVARALLVARLGGNALWGLAVAGALARLGPVFLVVALPYVTPEGASKSRDLVRASTKQAAVAAAWCAVLLAAAVSFDAVTLARGAVVAALVAVITVQSGRVYLRRAGGVTGDFLGATEQLGEIVALVALVWGNP